MAGQAEKLVEKKKQILYFINGDLECKSKEVTINLYGNISLATIGVVSNLGYNTPGKN